MFTAVSTTETQELLLSQFHSNQSTLRLLIATTAFGLGVDCMEIKRVVNFGTPNTLEELVQESGRAGRNGEPAESILYPRTFGKKSHLP